MNLLLDTHTFLWFWWDDPKLSEIAKQLIVEPENRKLVSTASCWEVAIKVSLKKLDLGGSINLDHSVEIADIEAESHE